MAGDKSTNYVITADPSGFQAAMQSVIDWSAQASTQIQSSFSSLQNSMQSVSDAFSQVTKMMGGLSAVMAGGAAFKAVIGAANDWNGEAKKLAVQLGVTTEKASVMMVAMRHLGIDSETLSMASGKMSKQIASNSQAFETLGVKVKDSNGQYRPTLDIMTDVNDKLKAIQNPIQQNIAGTAVYGKSWNDVRGILKLTGDEIKAATQKAKDLGLVVGDEAVAQTRQYKMALADMGLVTESLEVQFGNALLPAFVKLGSWLSGTGPVVAKVAGMAINTLTNICGTLADTVMDVWSVISDGFKGIGQIISEVMGTEAPSAMEIFANVLKLVEIAFAALRVGVQVILEGIKGDFEQMIASAVMFANVAQKALAMDFSGAKAAWEEGCENIDQIQQKHMQKLVEIAQAGRDKIDDIVMGNSDKKPPEIKDKDVSGGPKYDFDQDKGKGDKSRMQGWEAKLAADKDGFAQAQAIAGTAREFSLQQEAEYWKNILDTAKLSTEEKAQVERKYYGVQASIRKEAFDAEIAGLKANMEAFKNDHVQRQAIAEKIYQENVARYGEGSKEAKAAMAEVVKEKRAQADQIMQVNKQIEEQQRTMELATIDQAEAEAQDAVAQHKMTQAQLLQAEQTFEQQRYQIKLKALREQQALLKGTDQDPVAVAKINAQIESLDQQHQAKLVAIQRKSTQEENQITNQMYQSIQSGMTNVVEQAMKGSATMSSVLQSMMHVVTDAVINMIAQTAEKWLANLVMQQVQSKTASLGQISANAGVAGAAATASAAAIPMVGWMMAPEAGAAAMASAMAFAPMASAAGGYDIPAGLNPVVQTHASEMILPAKYADMIRSVTNNGSGGSGSSPTINYHDNTGTLTHAQIRKNVGVIAKALQEHAKKS